MYLKENLEYHHPSIERIEKEYDEAINKIKNSKDSKKV